MWSNLSKTFKYVNSEGGTLIFEPDYGFLINKPAGIDAVSVSYNRAQGINQVGVTLQGKKIEPRPINVSGKLIGDFQTENKENLLSVLRPDIPGRFFADDYFVDVRLTETPNIEEIPRFAHFAFSMLAPYPYWQHAEKNAASLKGVIPRFKLPCNFSKPYRFGEIQEAKFITVENSGQVPVPFKVTFYAKEAVKNPKLSNAVTGNFIAIAKAMQTGEKITVDITHDRTYVTSSVDGDIAGALTLDSLLNRLEVGKNILKPEKEGSAGKLEVEVEYATEKVGISL